MKSANCCLCFLLALSHPQLTTSIDIRGLSGSLPLQNAFSRELFTDVLTDCQKTSIFRYRETILGSTASQSDSDYHTIEVTSRPLLGLFGEEQYYLDPGAFATSLFLSELDRTDGGKTIEFESPSFGRQGEYTEELLIHHSLLKKFWNVEKHPSYSDIILLPLHSDVLEANLETAITYYLTTVQTTDFTLSLEYRLTDVVSDARSAIEALPDSYTNPALTFDAQFAIPALVNRGEFSNSSFILLGDGMLDYLDSLGLREVGSYFVHAHEFAHAVVFLREIREHQYDRAEYVRNQKVPSSAASAKAELEVDAMAAYALAHEQGLNFSVTQLVQAADVAASIGDRLDFLSTHHGTPERRACAARFGANEGRRNNGSILSSEEFHDLFDEIYPSIAALDPSVCSFEGASEPLPTVVCSGDDTFVNGWSAVATTVICSIALPWMLSVLS